MRNLKELRGMTEKEIREELDKVGRLLMEMKMGIAQSQLKKVSDIKLNKKYVARMHTVLNERTEEQVKPAA